MRKRFFAIVAVTLFLLTAQIIPASQVFLRANAENDILRSFNYADENGVFLLSMQKGASVRIGKDENDNGIRFTAEISAENKAALDEKYGAENVTYGMLILKLTDVQKNGEPDGERVFSKNSVYNWAKNGRYTVEEGKTRIINLTTKSAYLAKSEDKYLIRGSVSGILDKNLTVERIARAYVKCSSKGGETYYFSDFKLENARSVVYVADNAVVNGDDLVGAKYRDWLLENYIMKAVNLKRAAFEDAECSINDYQEAEKAYEELMLLANSLSETNYEACFSAEDAQKLNMKIDALYSVKSDEKRLIKSAKTETIAAPTPKDKNYEFCEEDGVTYLKKDGFYVRDGRSSVETEVKNAKVWKISCKSTNTILNFPPVNFSEYDKISFDINLSEMNYATIFGGKIETGKRVNVLIASGISKLVCYADGVKISETTDGDLIFNKKPLTMEFIGCKEDGYAELGVIYGEKYTYDTVSETKSFDGDYEEITVDGETVKSVSGVYAVPNCDIFSANGKLMITADSGGDVKLFLPSNDFRINRDLSFGLTFHNLECAKLGDVVLPNDKENNVTLKYISGNVIEVYIDGEPYTTIRDYEITSGKKPVGFDLIGCKSLCYVELGEITYTRYNEEESLSDGVEFDSGEARAKALNGKMTSFKQGFYATNCEKMTATSYESINSGLCFEFVKTAEDYAEVILPAFDYTQNDTVKFKIATEGVTTIAVDGLFAAYGDLTGEVTITYSKDKKSVSVAVYNENDGETQTIRVTNESIINGAEGLTFKFAALGDNPKVYIGDMTISGVKTYAKLRIPSSL